MRNNSGSTYKTVLCYRLKLLQIDECNASMTSPLWVASKHVLGWHGYCVLIFSLWEPGDQVRHEEDTGQAEQKQEKKKWLLTLPLKLMYVGL